MHKLVVTMLFIILFATRLEYFTHSPNMIPPNLQEIKNIAERGEMYLLRRSAINTYLYEAFRARTDRDWVSLDDNVRVRFLGALPVMTPAGKMESHFADDEMRYSLRLNDYPYLVAENIVHLTLWSSHPLPSEKVEEILASELSPDRSNRYWFEQVPLNKSVKGVWHVHVFVQRN